jgi:hypothetical protein
MGSVFFGEVVEPVANLVSKTRYGENQQNMKISKNIKKIKNKRVHGKQLRFPYVICRPYRHCFQVSK